MRTSTPIACLLLDPFPLWCAQRQHAGVPVAVSEHGRIIHANTAAVKGGVRRGMNTAAAFARVPDLAVEPLAPGVLAGAWDALLEDLFAYSPKVEALRAGCALLTLRDGPARELAALLHARVGLAETREAAQLAALSAQPGEVRHVPQSALPAFLSTLPVSALHGVGLHRDQVERLHTLGVRFAGQLAAWSAAQQAAFLGADARLLKPFLRGPGSAGVAAYRPASRLEAGLDFDDVLHEPHQTQAALAVLARDVHGVLAGQHAARLTVRARTPLGWLEGARDVKEPLRDPEGVARLAWLALGDSGAAQLGIERLEVILSGLQQPHRQVGLWLSARDLDVVRGLLARFPHALVKAEVRDEHAYASDARYRWVDFHSGEARGGRAHRAKPLGAPATPSLARSSAGYAGRV